MKLHYYPETDSLYIELKAAPGAETREVAPGLNVDLDAAGNVVGFDIDGAAPRPDDPRNGRPADEDDKGCVTGRGRWKPKREGASRADRLDGTLRVMSEIAKIAPKEE